MTEAKLQTRFSRWLRHNIEFPFAYELKLTKTKRFNFNSIRDHQITALHNAKHKKLCYKIPDVGMSRKPFDGFVLAGVPSVVGVMFYTKGAKNIYLLDIDTILNVRDEQVSITEKEANDLSWRVVTLK